MDSVSTAFELMVLELETAVEDLNSEGARLFQLSKYDDARILTEKGNALQEFRDRIDALAREWEERFSQPCSGAEREERNDEAARKILSASKSPKTGLLVRFGDGHVIAEATAAMTLALAIKRIGFERVAALGVLVNKENIVSREASKRYHDTFISPYYVKTHSSTDQKRNTLEQISDELGLNLSVSVVP